MKKWIVYAHLLNDKMYIGYTGQGLLKRLENHIREAHNGSERHFCKAIRKYGAENLKSMILYETLDLGEAKRKEREFIRKYDSMKNGYNMTDGGDGGNTIDKLSPAQRYNLGRRRSELSLGSKNNNWSGKTREEILSLALSVIIDNNMIWVRSDYMKRAKNLGYPINIYNSGMFIKSWKEDLLSFAQSHGYDLKEIRYRPTSTHLSNNTGVRKTGGKWFYNEKIKKSKFFNPDELNQINEDWIPGRKLKWD